MRFLALSLCIPIVSAIGADTPIERIDREMPRISKMVAQYARAFKTPGVAVAIVTPDDVRFISRGVREVGKPGAVNSSTIFQLASCSKPVTSTLAAALVSQGLLSWDESLADLLPGFRFENIDTTRRTTVGDMLTQRSGLPHEAGDTLEDIGYGRDIVLQQMQFVDTTPNFDTYAYANFGITIGGVAAAASEHRSFNSSLKKNLLGPLRMKDTFVPHSRLLRVRNRAKLHFTIEGKSLPLFVRNPEAQAPGGGVNTNARDMAKFLQLYLNDGRVGNRQVIKADVLRQVYEPISSLGKNRLLGRETFYGRCWVVCPAEGKLPLLVGHSGAFTSGARTSLNFWPAEKVGIVVLSNNFPSYLPEAIAGAFYQIYKTGSVKPHTLKHYVGAAKRDYNTDGFVFFYRNAENTGPVINGQPISAYAGTYRNDYTKSIVFDVRTDSSTGQPALFFTAGPDMPALEVQTVKGRNSLLVTTPTGNQIHLNFSDLENRAFQTLKIDDFNEVGWGTLTRVP